VAQVHEVQLPLAGGEDKGAMALTLAAAFWPAPGLIKRPNVSFWGGHVGRDPRRARAGIEEYLQLFSESSTDYQIVKDRSEKLRPSI